MNRLILTDDRETKNLISSLNQKNQVMKTLSDGGDVHDSIRGAVFCCVVSGSCSFSTIQELGEKGKIGVPYLLEIDNKQYVAKVSSFSPTFSVTENKRMRALGACFPQTPDISIGLDEFTNEVVIGYIIADTLEKDNSINNGKDFALLQSTSSICGNNAVSVTPYSSYGSLVSFLESDDTVAYRKVYRVADPISGDVSSRNILQPRYVSAVIAQIASSLHHLGNVIDFASGDLKMGNIFVEPSEVRGKYKSLDVSAPFKCRIGDYGKSSCSFTNNHGELVRIYNKSLVASAYLSLFSFKPTVYNDTSLRGRQYYVVDNYTIPQIYANMWHNTVAYYRHFDYYVFMFSFLSHPRVYYSFFGSSDLIARYWEPMWMTDDDSLNAEEVIREAAISGDYVGTRDAIEMLKGRRLRCSVLDLIV